MSDSVSSSFQAIVTRLESPVSGTFILSWLVVNWQIPIALVFGIDDINRITYIEKFLNVSNWWYLVWIPLTSTAVFLLLLPLLRRKYSIWFTNIEHKTAINQITRKKELAEIEEYHQTLKSMIGNINDRNEKLLSKVQTAHLLLKEGQYNAAIADIKEIETELEYQVKQYHHFRNTYAGPLENSYRTLIERFMNPRLAREAFSDLKSVLLSYRK